MEKTSRTQKKKAAQASQKIGEQLVKLGETQLAAMDLPADLVEAVKLARQMTRHEARRRQMQYIGSLMRQLDVERIKKEIDDIARQDYEAVRRFKLAERWRDALVAGDDSRLARLAQQLPDPDQGHLVRLVRNARDASAPQKASKAARELFRFLHQRMDSVSIS